MRRRAPLKRVTFALFLGGVVLSGGGLNSAEWGLFPIASAIAAERASTSGTEARWSCYSLLDRKTQRELVQFEAFFFKNYQTAQDRYDRSSEDQKKRLVGQQTGQLRAKDSAKIVEAAALLGIAQAKPAAKALEAILARRRGGGRVRWVCTRSLGRIGEKGSIPTLIGLLDNANKETRLYARVSLAQITGVYHGENKAQWRAALKNDSTAELVLKFHLPDSNGRIVDSQDYAGLPVLLMSGSCWCGGCQQDAEPLRKIAAELGPRGLQTIRTVAGDNELAALDFQKHYRHTFVQLMDTNRIVEKRYNEDGWTFLMLADRQGKVVLRLNSPKAADWRRIRSRVIEMLPRTLPVKKAVRDGVSYLRSTLERTGEIRAGKKRDRFPSIACGPDGKVYVVFTSNRHGSSDVFIRVFDGEAWSDDRPVAASKREEYDGTVVVDNDGRAWVSWTSNASSLSREFMAASRIVDRYHRTYLR